MMKLVFQIIFLLTINSCKYKLSTYSADTPEQKLNLVNLKRIRAAESTVGTNFKVAFISDTHNYYEELDSLISTINSRGPYSFVIVSGDITNLGLLEEFNSSRKFLNRLKYPYLVAPGNHDLIANGDIIFKKMFGPGDFEFSYKNNHFILFDNNNWENSDKAPDLSWLEDKLSSSTGSEKILVAHVSPDDRDRFTDSEIADMEMMIDQYNVKYFIHGHNHSYNESEFGNAFKITVGAPSKGSYFELEFSAGGVTHQKVDF